MRKCQKAVEYVVYVEFVPVQKHSEIGMGGHIKAFIGIFLVQFVERALQAGDYRGDMIFSFVEILEKVQDDFLHSANTRIGRYVQQF